MDSPLFSLLWSPDPTSQAAIGLVLLAFAAAVALFNEIGKEFFPPSDNGMFFVRFETPPGTSLDRSLEYLTRNEEFVLSLPEHKGMFSAVGVGRHRGPGSSNEGLMFVILESKHDRERTVQELERIEQRAFSPPRVTPRFARPVPPSRARHRGRGWSR